MDKDALRKLIEAVDAGKAELGGNQYPWTLFMHVFPAGGEWDTAFIGAKESYQGSLDAAKALHEALLPGWAWALEAADVAEVWPLGRLFTSIRCFSDGAGPARAWLLAVLKAVEAQP
jgi:hypothetical protein